MREKFYFHVLFFFRNYRPRSREFERNHTIRNRVDVSRNERVRTAAFHCFTNEFSTVGELCRIIVRAPQRKNDLVFATFNEPCFTPSVTSFSTFPLPFPFITEIISTRCARKGIENFPENGRGGTPFRVLSPRFRRERDPLTRFPSPSWLLARYYSFLSRTTFTNDTSLNLLREGRILNRIECGEKRKKNLYQILLDP